MNRRALLVLGSLFSIALFVIIGCGSDSSPTNPGGGGGGGGPTFDFHFPATGVSHSFTFTTAGTWAYHCTPHASSGMTGTVVVDAGSANDSALVQVGSGNALSFSPSSVTIKPNGSVRWVNASSMTNHTVTRP
jgi:plastocyanin